MRGVERAAVEVLARVGLALIATVAALVGACSRLVWGAP